MSARPALLLPCAVLLGCAGTPPTTLDAPSAVSVVDGGADAGMSPTDAARMSDTAPTACIAPAGPYGALSGAIVEDFTLPHCDGAPYTFYDDAYCAPEHTATVIVFAALWCSVCQNEALSLDAMVTEAYADRGVRVVQVLVDGAVPGTAVTGASCQTWVDTFSLATDVLFDAEGAITRRYFPEGSFPVSLVVDAAGVIQYRDVHGGRGIDGIRAALDGLLTPR